jgi:hypothetical protein
MLYKSACIYMRSFRSCSWCLWKALDEEGCTGVVPWIQNVGDIDFKVISATENSNKFQKTRFWKKKSVEGHTSNMVK